MGANGPQDCFAADWYMLTIRRCRTVAAEEELVMGMFRKLKIGGKVTPAIDWEMTPDMTFGTFESWGAGTGAQQQ